MNKESYTHISQSSHRISSLTLKCTQTRMRASMIVIIYKCFQMKIDRSDRLWRIIQPLVDDNFFFVFPFFKFDNWSKAHALQPAISGQIAWMCYYRLSFPWKWLNEAERSKQISWLQSAMISTLSMVNYLTLFAHAKWRYSNGCITGRMCAHETRTYCHHM